MHDSYTLGVVYRYAKNGPTMLDLAQHLSHRTGKVPEALLFNIILLSKYLRNRIRLPSIHNSLTRVDSHVSNPSRSDA